ncbi:MAG: C69 family dipeptidase [Pseudomonadota bacterium]
MKKTLTITIGLLGGWLLAAPQADACTNFMVSPGASADGSSMITYAADSHVLYGELYHTPAGSHAPGQLLDVHEWDTGKFMGRIPQVPRTYAVVGLMNEHQVTIGETTYGGREELVSDQGVLDYGSLMFITLQRAKTAREAVELMGALVAEHGYRSSGEAFTIGDPDEVWFMGMIGKGKGRKGAVWVARRVPDGSVSAHANTVRIGTFPLNDQKNTLYSEDVISFAREMKFFDGADADFSFTAAYAPMTWKDARICEARVWSFFRQVAPSLDLAPNFVDPKTAGEVTLPLWVKPDRKLTQRDLMHLMRDHFEGTPLDLSKGVGAGPYERPYRWRPLFWEVDGKKYTNERSTATQQTGFSFVAQMRKGLPGPIGGLFWFSVDDAASTVYVPMYAGIREAPWEYRVGNGDFETFTLDAAFWVFNWVANQAYGRYKDMIRDINVVQDELEGQFIALQPEVDAAALALWKESPELARDYLTAYSARQAKKTVDRWRSLGAELFVRYLDGNVRDARGEVTHPADPEHWYKRIIEDSGDHFLIRRLEGEPAEVESH